MEPNLSTLLATASVTGVVVHQVLFKRVELDPHPLLIAISFLGAPPILAYILKTYTIQYANSSQSTAYILVGCFTCSLWISILTYRAFFHPLSNFPGPFPARLSKLWALTQAAKTHLKWYQVDAELHKQYGDYVRTGFEILISSFLVAG